MKNYIIFLFIASVFTVILFFIQLYYEKENKRLEYCILGQMLQIEECNNIH